MRSLSQCPAEKLHSVASRYRSRVSPDRSRRNRCESSHQWMADGAALTAAESARRSKELEQSTSLDKRACRVEAILFLAREPLSARRLSQYANLADGTEARTLIRHLNQQYDVRNQAFRIEEIAGGFQLLTRAPFASWLRRLGHVPAETRLSVPALETLAVVAYRQPVMRADIEAVRGVNCGEILRQLMERDLIRICGRSEELGRPYLYGTTKRFLLTFGLVDLDHLPRAEVLRTIAVRPAGMESLNSIKQSTSESGL